MTDDCLCCSLIGLVVLLTTMDVPSQRVADKDWPWLRRNLGIRNSEHPNFDEAMRLLKGL